MPLAFPGLLACYQIALTIPVASASAERSFSTMRHAPHQDVYLRSSMSVEKLSSLAVIVVERQLTEELVHNPSKMIDEFARSSNGRLIDLLM